MTALISGGSNWGRYLDVDLANHQIHVREVDAGFAEEYVGGRGYSSKLQYDSLGPEVDPLESDNILILSTGPLCGTLAPAGNRITIGAKSPLTGILGDSHMGGWFGPALRSAGYEYAVFRGKAHEPTLLLIENERVELQEAKYLWGKDTFEGTELLTRKFGKGFEHILIGPAGENLVRYASVISKNMRAAGRTGMGAVMGSKNLKAVVVRGDKKARVARPQEFQEAREYVLGLLRSDPFVREVGSPLGTNFMMSVFNEVGALSTRNWRESVFEDVEKISGERIVGEYLVRSESCPSCPVGCSKIVQVPSGEFESAPTRIEYLGICGFGSNLGNNNAESIIKAYELCNRYGMDVAEAQGILACAFECYENKLIDREDTAGLDLAWGNASVIPVLLEKIAFREGFGEALAEGVRPFAEGIGEGAERLAMHVKGLVMDVGEPRVFKTYISRLRVASRGGDHLRGQGPGGYLLDEMPLEQGVAEVIHNEVVCALCDMMGVCKFPYGLYSSTRDISKKKAMTGLRELFSAVAGRTYTWEELTEKAERVINVERAVNCREGLRRKDDDFPRRFLEEPVSAGPAKGQIYDMSDSWLDEYYGQRGWDLATGVPTEDKLRELRV